MVPTILGGDRLVVDKLAYGLRVPFTLTHLAQWDDPQRSDIVTFPTPDTNPENHGELYVKRIVAIPGDTIQLKQNVLIINGIAARYTEVDPSEYADFYTTDADTRLYYETIYDETRVIRLDLTRAGSRSQTFGPVTLGEDEYWVMGDNRDNSLDSRRWGVLTRDRITGRAHAVAFSLDQSNWYRPRAKRLFINLD